MDLMISIYETYLAPGDVETVTQNGKSQNGHHEPPYQYHKQVQSMMQCVRDQREKLAKEVEKWCQERGV